MQPLRAASRPAAGPTAAGEPRKPPQRIRVVELASDMALLIAVSDAHRLILLEPRAVGCCRAGRRLARSAATALTRWLSRAQAPLLLADEGAQMLWIHSFRNQEISGGDSTKQAASTEMWSTAGSGSSFVERIQPNGGKKLAGLNRMSSLEDREIFLLKILATTDGFVMGACRTSLKKCACLAMPQRLSLFFVRFATFF